MNKYQIDYYTLEGDYAHIWVEAYDKDDARVKAHHEYWDIKQIIDIHKI